MTLSALPSYDKLTRAVSLVQKDRDIVCNFGDNYTQIAPIGVEPSSYSGTGKIAPLTEVEFDTLQVFLELHGQGTPFLIPIAGEEALVVKCLSWKRQDTPLAISIALKQHHYAGATPI